MFLHSEDLQLYNPLVCSRLFIFFSVQVVLIHSRTALADTELLASVRQQAKEVLLEKGVELLLGTRTCSYLWTGVSRQGLI